jgi:hypothetical protein
MKSCTNKTCTQVKKLAVDHCHKTGKIRGLLCQGCNMALGLLKDSPAIINNLARYINKHAVDVY